MRVVTDEGREGTVVGTASSGDPLVLFDGHPPPVEWPIERLSPVEPETSPEEG